MEFGFRRRLVLGISGLAAITVGLAITLDPQAFYASYGIVLTPQPNLMSELRAPAANLAVLGLIILSGALYKRITHSAALLGTAVFLAFAMGRVVSLALDGRPSDSILAALGIEVVLALLCLWVAAPRRQRADKVSGAGVGA
ncbi:DUF4345 domain-containing protein [Tateyamaria sp. Alg231-49]|uniref:DUF4345 domain-containing protein n=1 Tax=Tateyamaria sp. Alg231-49 TaxID=1922219 RepID=UPI000D557E56|nr:DUF4345 domain-containing protein [Tateyamaria sp. Alg231-49]